MSETDRAKKRSLLAEIRSDFRVPLERDPAVGHWLEVMLAYPGVHAVIAYRLIHRLALRRVPVVPRVLSHIVRFATGIEIHPSAAIGTGFFIDHGMGVVIGGTAIVGDNVTLYQGVTLGGTSLAREKRHPTIGDNVVIGVGASVLGNITVGDNSRIGAGSVVVKDVPVNATVVGVPGRVVLQDGRPVQNIERRMQVDMPDPAARALTVLETKVNELASAVKRLEERHAAKRNDGRNDDVSAAI